MDKELQEALELTKDDLLAKLGNATPANIARRPVTAYVVQRPQVRVIRMAQRAQHKVRTGWWLNLTAPIGAHQQAS